MTYICPICQSPLQQHLPSKGYYCENKHHFDIAKEGYLNLLPVQHKKSKEPGDSRAMMRSRRSFLEAGFYQPLAQTITALIDQHRTVQPPMHILDMGCGEGYYSRQIEALCQHPEQLDLHGIDIAKNAILAAAKKQPNAHFIVASNKRMPYADHYFDLIVIVYAPANDAEVVRLLKTDGLLLTVTPGPRHLWQLKEFIYKEVKEHKVEIDLPEGYEQIDSRRLSYTITPDQEHRMALLQMTPFAWRAKGEIQSRIQRAQDLEIETDFIITLATKR
ncbi:23S rRNA (guanine(745)-N(1))-methyltransferase [Methylomarinum sp. Ch1-1]|uniref:23S rRNA (Guanine(745)-N(1))-methyltransferase n=1 Tax=Methylomarinum roseum TaxID=3067653 RepID=A0AAU7NQC0_9GAMM|nr:23S rRNA (guanine(745)-N(1))-methyltransferase [Methylomarinum sp. Ch1-1]MDP4520889.1 23S rRNA (guanine(745)-N(1))-methyltransferase [Methylomarinum sp. Ch1-1]